MNCRDEHTLCTIVQKSTVEVTIYQPENKHDWCQSTFSSRRKNCISQISGRLDFQKSPLKSGSGTMKPPTPSQRQRQTPKRTSSRDLLRGFHPSTLLRTPSSNFLPGALPLDLAGSLSSDSLQGLRPCSAHQLHFNCWSFLYVHLIPYPFNFLLNRSIPCEECAFTSIGFSFPSFIDQMISPLPASGSLNCPSCILLSILPLLPFTLSDHSASPRPSLSAIHLLHQSVCNHIPYRPPLICAPVPIGLSVRARASVSALLFSLPRYWSL